MAASRRERRKQAREDWRGRRAVRKRDRKTRKARRREDKAARSGLKGREKRQTRRTQRSTRRAEFAGMRESRGSKRREERVTRKLAFKPERATEVCSPEGARKRAVFAGVVTNPFWVGAAQSLNTGAKVLWAAPEPTMVSKVAAGIADGIGYSMKGASIAGPSINQIREELACAMVAELEAAGAVPPELGPALEREAADIVEQQWDEIPSAGGRESSFDPANADEAVKKNEWARFVPLIAVGMAALWFARSGK